VHLELVDLLRCPRPHPATWLVAAADRMEGRHVMEGSLGCPICETVYPIRDGVAELVAPDAVSAASAPGASAADAAPPAPVDDVLRVAAMLDLADPGGVVVLVGSWGDYAHAIAALVDAHVLVVDPLWSVPMHAAVSVVHTGGAAIVPLAQGAVRSAAADRPAAVVAAIRSGGRLVAAAAATRPAGVSELARDAQHWVGVVDAPGSPPVALRRAVTPAPAAPSPSGHPRTPP